MAVQLTPEQKAYYKDLRENFKKHVEEYKKKKIQELQEGKLDELNKELKNIEGYLHLYHTTQVSDLQINIRFKHAKVIVLKELLKK